MNQDRLYDVLRIQSESYNQWRMFAYIIRQLNAIDVDYYVQDGNIYAIKGKSDYVYPCIVAHMDTVHSIKKDLTVINFNGYLTGFDRSTMTQAGIGGDDKVGIFIALECLRLFPTIKAVFFRDEESGCDGSYEADMDFFDDCGFVLQCDRKGNDDFVINASGIELSSFKFQEDLEETILNYGYDFSHGYMTDVQALKENGIPCCVANMSCGYYNPHEDNEYICLDDVENCLNMVRDIIHKFGDQFYVHILEDDWMDDGDEVIAVDKWMKWKENNPEEYCIECGGLDPLSNGYCKTCNNMYADLGYQIYL